MHARARAAVLGACLSFGLTASPGASQPPDASATLPAAPIPYSRLFKPHPRHAAKPKPRAAAPVQASGSAAAAAAPGPGLTDLPPPQRPSVAISPSQPAPPPAVAVAAPPLQRQPIPAAELQAFVDGTVAQARVDDHVAGVAVAIVQGGQLLLEKGYGLAGGEPSRAVDPRATLFRLGSVSKIFTWIEVLKAASAGRLRLQGPINEALPEAVRVPAEGFAAPIRVDQLMAHTAGFEARELGRLFARSADASLPLERELTRVRPRRVREPGELSSYSNYGAALAGEAAAFAARSTFEDLVERDLLQPAKMTSTSFREPHPVRDDLPAPLASDLAGRMAQGFHWSATGFHPQPFAWGEGLAPAISASSTAHDMARLMAALLAGGRSPEGGVLWDARADAALHATLHRGAPGLAGWTHGLMEEALPGGIPGLGQDGAVPGFRSNLVVAPSLGLGVFVVTNTDSGERLAEHLPAEIVRRFYPAAPPAPTAPPTAPPTSIDPGPADRFTGLYLTTRRAYHGLEGFVDRLTGLARVRAVPGGRLFVSDRGRAHEWAPAGANRFVDADARQLAFTPIRSGRAAGYVEPGSGAYERVGLLHEPATLAAAAAMAAMAALLCIAGPFVRAGHEARQTPAQAFSSRVQLLTSLALIGSLVAFAVFLRRAHDPAQLMLNWPDGWLTGASWASLGAALLTLLQTVQLRRVWGGTRRLPGWSAGRRLRHTLTVATFLGFAIVAAAWGALEPWSS